jgi:hypothetical protein
MPCASSVRTSHLTVARCYLLTLPSLRGVHCSPPCAVCWACAAGSGPAASRAPQVAVGRTVYQRSRCVYTDPLAARGPPCAWPGCSVIEQALSRGGEVLVGLRVCAAFAGCLPWDEITTKNHTRPRPLPPRPVLLQLRTQPSPRLLVVRRVRGRVHAAAGVLGQRWAECMMEGTVGDARDRNAQLTVAPLGHAGDIRRDTTLPKKNSQRWSSSCNPALLANSALQFIPVLLRQFLHWRQVQRRDNLCGTERLVCCQSCP